MDLCEKDDEEEPSGTSSIQWSHKYIYTIFTIIILLVFLSVTVYYISFDRSGEHTVVVESGVKNLSGGEASGSREVENWEKQYKELEESYRDIKANYTLLKSRYRSKLNIPSPPSFGGLDYTIDRNSNSEDSLVLTAENLEVVGVGPTKSMVPVFSEKSMLITTQDFNPFTLSEGSIIIYGEKEKVHRVVGVSKGENTCYITQGDANRGVDEECVMPDSIKSLVVGVLYRKP